MLARLLGNAGGSGPGVIGLEMPWNTIVHEGGKAVAKVRRAGGSAGSATVSYVVRPITGGGASQQDFEARSGELTWADGDSGDKEIDVSIASDSESEDPELFEIALESTTGGAGLGTSGAEFEIAGRTYPHGEFGFDYQQIDVAEDTDLYFNVTRFYYGEGAASVTVQVTGGDATPGTDFTLVGANASNAIVLNWADGQWGNRTVHVRVPRDTAVEPREMVQLELVSPSGATLGANSRLTIGIANSIPPPPPPPPNNGGRGSSHGGGQLAGFEAMMLGLLAMLRRCLRGRRHD
jgi:hypothetical protein